MRTLVVRPEGAKKAATIPSCAPEQASPRLLVHPPPPAFEPPDPSLLPPDDDVSTDLEPSESPLPPLYRKASRRALHAHRFRLVACQYELIVVVALNRTCLEIGHASVAQGGIAPADISFPMLLTKAHAMEAAGIIVMQNRPGHLDDETPIDPHLTVDLAIFCELAGIPLIEHMYIYRDGWPFFVRERGLLSEVPTLLARLREGKDAIAKKELGQGRCTPKDHERSRVPHALPEALPPIEITTRRRR